MENTDPDYNIICWTLLVRLIIIINYQDSFRLLNEIILLLYNSYLTRNFNYWKNRGINGPRPIVGIGTIYQIFTKDIRTNMLENYKKYGKIYGYFKQCV